MQYFREIRHALNLSQAEMAKELGVTQQAVARYENPNYDIPENIILLMEAKLHVNREFLKSGTGEKFTVPESIARYKEEYQQILKHVFEMNQEELEDLINYLESYEFKNL